MKTKQQLLAELYEDLECFGKDKIIYVWYEMYKATTVVATQANGNYLDNENLEDNIERQIIIRDYADEPIGNCQEAMYLSEVQSLLESME